jgi:hypothetical protein
LHRARRDAEHAIAILAPCLEALEELLTGDIVEGDLRAIRTKIFGLAL